MKLSFYVDESSQWLERIAKQIGCEVKNDTILFPINIADGYMKNIYLPNGMSVNFLHAKFNEPIIASRKATTHTPYSPIHFYIHDKQVVQCINGERKQIGQTSANGIFWPSASIESIWEFPAFQWINNLVININHNRLLERINDNNDLYLKRLLESDKSFYLFEHISPAMIILLKDINDLLEAYNLNLSNQLLLEGKVTQILGLFIQMVNKRKTMRNVMNLNTQDVDRLFMIKSDLMKDLSKTPQVKELAQTYGFSESKLQKLFKQVFGKSLYQYAIYERMLWAHKMLSTESCSVSEVGYSLGYSNLSHFTKIFRNQFGINPKSFKQKFL